MWLIAACLPYGSRRQRGWLLGRRNESLSLPFIRTRDEIASRKLLRPFYIGPSRLVRMCREFLHPQLMPLLTSFFSNAAIGESRALAFA